jgi:hypothetical protein
VCLFFALFGYDTWRPRRQGFWQKFTESLLAVVVGETPTTAMKHLRSK